MREFPPKTKTELRVEEDWEETVPELLREMLDDNWNTRIIAELLDISRRTVWNWMEKYHIQRTKCSWLRSKTIYAQLDNM